MRRIFSVLRSKKIIILIAQCNIGSARAGLKGPFGGFIEKHKVRVRIFLSAVIRKAYVIIRTHLI